ncbi:MAG: AAA family ATPase, partial [Bacteroidota bacterium]
MIICDRIHKSLCLIVINRTISNRILSKVGRGKAIIIVGPRQVGKTTLIQNLLKEMDYRFFDGDDPTVRSVLDSPNTQEIRRLIGN